MRSGFGDVAYRCSIEIIDLKRKFEEDKEKIDKMKQSRKFNPY